MAARSRQMLLGWHYMDYYANAYAVNQYLASRGFTVLSVNYRLGIGYGRAFQQPDRRGGARRRRISGRAGGRELSSIACREWMARASAFGAAPMAVISPAWRCRAIPTSSRLASICTASTTGRCGWRKLSGRRNATNRATGTPPLKTAFEASPDAQIANWRSPVLLIQGDDDRNVRFNQTVDAARRLKALGVPFEEMVIPDEIHGFLRHDSWRRADEATARFLAEKLGADNP